MYQIYQSQIFTSVKQKFIFIHLEKNIKKLYYIFYRIILKGITKFCY